MWDDNSQLRETFCSGRWLTSAASNRHVFELMRRLWLVEVWSLHLSGKCFSGFVLRSSYSGESVLDGWSLVRFCVIFIETYLFMVCCFSCVWFRQFWGSVNLTKLSGNRKWIIFYSFHDIYCNFKKFILISVMWRLRYQYFISSEDVYLVF